MRLQGAKQTTCALLVWHALIKTTTMSCIDDIFSCNDLASRHISINTRPPLQVIGSQPILVVGYFCIQLCDLIAEDTF